MRVLALFLLLSVLETGVFADCTIDSMHCCIAEFLRLISPENGFDLTTQSILRTCKTLDDSSFCLKEFETNCTSDRPLIKSIQEAQEIMTGLCSAESELFINIRDKPCLADASGRFKDCLNLNKSTGTGETKECCEYDSFKICAVETTRDFCNGSESQLVQQVVMNTNGLGYEVYCEDDFKKCSSDDAHKTTISLLCIFFYLAFWL